MLEYQRKYVCVKCKHENDVEAQFENRFSIIFNAYLSDFYVLTLHKSIYLSLQSCLYAYPNSKGCQTQHTSFLLQGKIAQMYYYSK